MHKLIMNFMARPEWSFLGTVLSVFTFFGLTQDNLFSFMDNKEWIINSIQWSLIFGSFIFSLYAYYKPLKNKKNDGLSDDDEMSVIRSFALRLAKADGAVFTWDGIHHDSYVLQNGSWEEWIMSLNSGMIADPTVNFSNYGSKYYFLDLVSLKKIQIPMGVETKKRVGDDIKNGMVLIRKEIEKA